MIPISSTSMVVNDIRSPVTYEMDYTITILRTTTIEQIVQRILVRLTGVTSRIQNLILNAHGAPGGMFLGTGLHTGTMDPFQRLQGKVFKIWFTGCWVGRIIDSQTATQGDGAALHRITSGNGHSFLSAFARLTQCYVVAPTEAQSNEQPTYPRGMIDSFEGLLLCYDPQGNISWRHRYASTQWTNFETGRGRTPNHE